MAVDDAFTVVDVAVTAVVAAAVAVDVATDDAILMVAAVIIEALSVAVVVQCKCTMSVTVSSCPKI